MWPVTVKKKYHSTLVWYYWFGIKTIQTWIAVSFLRLLTILTECFMLVRYAMFSSTFYLITRVGLPWFLEPWVIVVCVKINSLPFNKCFRFQKVLQNGANALSQNGFKNSVLCQTIRNFVHFGPYELVQISPACVPNTYQIMYEETLSFQC